MQFLLYKLSKEVFFLFFKNGYNSLKNKTRNRSCYRSENKKCGSVKNNIRRARYKSRCKKLTAIMTQGTYY